MYSVDPTGTGVITAQGPQATLEISSMGPASTILNCATTPTRLTAATVTFKGDTYGCLGDDAELAACAL
jgi:hypothetical protein